MIFGPNAFKMGIIIGRLAFDPSTPFGPFNGLPGEILQIQNTENFTIDTTALVIPSDNTTPQIGEGKEYFSSSFTPLRATSQLLINCYIPFVSCNPANNFVGALFRTIGPGAFAAGAQSINVANDLGAFQLIAVIPANAAVATTISFRYGPGAAGNAYVLQNGAGAFFNGAGSALLSIAEIAV